MRKEILLSLDRALHLTNVVCNEVYGEMSAAQVCMQTDNYILVNGALPVGPTIQHVRMSPCEHGSPKESFIIRQASAFIAEKQGESVKTYEELVVQHCIYAHFEGRLDDLRYAYSKLYLAAYEQEIALRPENYTVFVSDENEESAVVDIFIPKV